MNNSGTTLFVLRSVISKTKILLLLTSLPLYLALSPSIPLAILLYIFQLNLPSFYPCLYRFLYPKSIYLYPSFICLGILFYSFYTSHCPSFILRPAPSSISPWLLVQYISLLFISPYLSFTFFPLSLPSFLPFSFSLSLRLSLPLFRLQTIILSLHPFFLLSPPSFYPHL